MRRRLNLGRANIKGQVVEERIHPDNYMFARHFYAYEQAVKYVSTDSIVIEAGSGDGYGSDYLAKCCRKVVGVDIEWDAVEEANRKYRSDKLSFVRASVLELPIAPGTADFICSMQVIEHLVDTGPYLCELREAMSEDATLFITTPYRESKGWRFDKIPSPFHVKEYTGEELRELLSGFFSNVEIKGIKFKEESEAGRSDESLGRVQSMDVLNLRRLVPSFAKPLIFKIVGFKPIADIKMNTSDFEIVDDLVDEVLDLVAICRK